MGGQSPSGRRRIQGKVPTRLLFCCQQDCGCSMVKRKEWEWMVSQFRSLLWLFVSCFLSTFASAGSERLTVAYPQWPPYKIVQNGTIGGIDALVLDEIARRTGLEFDYVECPWARCLIMLQNGNCGRRASRGYGNAGRCDGTQARRGSIAGEPSEIPRLRRKCLRLVLGNRSGLQIHAVDRECVWFKRGGSNRHGVLGSRSRP